MTRSPSFFFASSPSSKLSRLTNDVYYALESTDACVRCIVVRVDFIETRNASVFYLPTVSAVFLTNIAFSCFHSSKSERCLNSIAVSDAESDGCDTFVTKMSCSIF